MDTYSESVEKATDLIEATTSRLSNGEKLEAARAHAAVAQAEAIAAVACAIERSAGFRSTGRDTPHPSSARRTPPLPSSPYARLQGDLPVATRGP